MENKGFNQIREMQKRISENTAGCFAECSLLATGLFETLKIAFWDSKSRSTLVIVPQPEATKYFSINPTSLFPLKPNSDPNEGSKLVATLFFTA